MNLGSWKTTAAGAVPVIGALGSLINMFATGQWDGNVLMMNIMSASAGVGLMFAKDHNVSNSPTPVPVAKPVP
jgi:hypothetical protein